MNVPRRNEVAVIAHLAPRTVSWLQIPLTASRQAAFARFTLRTGADPLALVLDLLDDIIFDTGSVECEGEVSCTEHYRGGSAPQCLPAAELPSMPRPAVEKPLPAADLSPTTKTGSAQQLGTCTERTQASRSMSSHSSAMSEAASDTPPATLSRPPISSGDSCDPITASNGSTPSCREVTRLGGSITSARAASPTRSTLCGND
jgi:hypothetical protein